MSETPAPYFVAQRFEVFSSADRHGWVAAVVWLGDEWEVLVRSEETFATPEQAMQALAAAFPDQPVAETVAICDYDPYTPLPPGAYPLDPEPTDPVHWLDWRTRTGDPFSSSRGVVIHEPSAQISLEPVRDPPSVPRPHRSFSEWEREVFRRIRAPGTSEPD